MERSPFMFPEPVSVAESQTVHRQEKQPGRTPEPLKVPQGAPSSSCQDRSVLPPARGSSSCKGTGRKGRRAKISICRQAGRQTTPPPPSNEIPTEMIQPFLITARIRNSWGEIHNFVCLWLHRAISNVAMMTTLTNTKDGNWFIHFLELTVMTSCATDEHYPL